MGSSQEKIDHWLKHIPTEKTMTTEPVVEARRCTCGAAILPPRRKFCSRRCSQQDIQKRGTTQQRRDKYLATKDAVTAKREVAMAPRRAWLDAIKAAQGCRRCSENDPCCLEYHHIDPTTKAFTVSQALHRLSYTYDMVLEEIAKCTLLCSNCHMKEHRDMREKNKQPVEGESGCISMQEMPFRAPSATWRALQKPCSLPVYEYPKVLRTMVPGVGKHFAVYPGQVACMNCGLEWGQHEYPDNACKVQDTMVPGSEDYVRQALRKALSGYIGKPVDPALLAEIEKDVVDRLDTMVPGLTKSELEDMAKRGGSPPPSSSNVIRRT